MADSVAAELYKLRKRPASWLLGAVLVGGVVLLGYLSTYIFLLNARAGSGITLGAEQQRQTLSSLLPQDVIANVLGVLSGLGGPVALILGALAVGSEYGWGTLKTVLVQPPGRLGVFLGKAVATWLMFAVLSVAAFVAGALSAYSIAAGEGEAASWPSAFEAVEALAVTWLILAAYGAFGTFLATLFRGTALAVGLGLVYVVIIENLLASLPDASNALGSVKDFLISKVATDLATSFGTSPQAVAQTQLGGAGPLDPSRAALVLGVYTVVFTVMATVLFRLRDVAE